LQAALGGFLAKYRRDLQTALTSPETTDAQRATYRVDLAILADTTPLAPDVVIAKEGVRSIAGRSFDVHLERAATRGDVWLLDRQSRVLIAGDLVTLPAPFLDTACPQRWSAALDRLAAANFEILIPGHGAPMSRAQVEIYRAAFDGLIACAASDADEGECARRWSRQIGGLVPEEAHDFTGSMITYYTKQVLRNEAVIASSCG
jgi:glyoxylase-like metal-dependent hydrolase (beta-lactamase superfamily II)